MTAAEARASVSSAEANARAAGVTGRVDFRNEDLFEADFSAIAAHKAALAAKGTKLSYTAYLLKAAAEAMAVAPAVNGRWADDRIIVIRP